MRKLTWIFIAAIFLTLSLPGFADEPKPDAKKEPKVVFRTTERHQFAGAKLKGKLKKPELSYIYERKGLRQEKIVNIPENFNDEIIQGAAQF